MGWLADIYQENRSEDKTGMQIMYGIGGEKDLTETTLDHLERLRGREAGADRQRRLRPAPERRLRSAARLGLHPRQGPGPPAPRALGGALPPGRGGDHGLAEARPGDLGGARRAQALRLLEADVLGRRRPRQPPRATASATRIAWNGGRRSPSEIREDILENGRLATRRLPPALRAPTRSTLRPC